MRAPNKERPNFARKSKTPKIPLSLADYKRIRRVIREEGGRYAVRNLLLVNLQTNTCINSSDVLKFKTGTVFREGKIIDKFWIKQKNFNKSQLISPTRVIRKDIEAAIEDYSMRFGEDYFYNPHNPLFPSQAADKFTGRFKSISYAGYRSILRKLFSKLNMNLDYYGTHSLRAAIPNAYYLRTGDAKGAQALFEHKPGGTTIAYIETVTTQKAIEVRRELQFRD